LGGGVVTAEVPEQLGDVAVDVWTAARAAARRGEAGSNATVLDR
jgi:hypothetical protein